MVELWPLFRAVAARGAEAWGALLVELEPELAAMAKRQPIGRLRDREDSPREIVTRVLERLHSRGFAAIQKLCAMDPPPELQAWIRVIVRRSAIDYMREHPEFQRGNPKREHRWVSLASYNSGDGHAVGPNSLEKKRGELMAFVRGMVSEAQAEHGAHGEEALSRLALVWKVPRIHVRRLIARGTQYVTVLTSVLEGSSYPETADRLGLTRREVELTVRYIEDLLRAREFGVDPPEP